MWWLRSMLYSVLAIGLVVGLGPGGGLGASPASAQPGSEVVGQAYAEDGVGRLAGRNRLETAVSISGFSFPDGADTVFLARADVFADALAGGVLQDGPILLVPSCGALPQVVADEIARLDPDTVIALGAQAAVCDALLAEAAGSRETSRLAGTSRFDTAVAISQHTFPDTAQEVYLARATDSPDAVAGGTLTRGPILLVPRSGAVPEVIQGEIERLGPQRVVALGGTGAISDEVLAAAASGRPTDRLSGSTRFGTAVDISAYQFPEGADRVFLARADVFADAVAGGSLTGGPILLVPSCGTLPREVAAELRRLGASRTIALGGEGAVCSSMLGAAHHESAGRSWEVTVFGTDHPMLWHTTAIPGALVATAFESDEYSLRRSTDAGRTWTAVPGAGGAFLLRTVDGPQLAATGTAVHRVTADGLEHVADLPQQMGDAPHGTPLAGLLASDGTLHIAGPTSRWRLAGGSWSETVLQRSHGDHHASGTHLVEGPGGPFVLGYEYSMDGSDWVAPRLWDTAGQILATGPQADAGALLDVERADGVLHAVVSHAEDDGVGTSIATSSDGRTWEQRPVELPTAPAGADEEVYAAPSAFAIIGGQMTLAGNMVRYRCPSEGPCAYWRYEPAVWTPAGSGWAHHRLPYESPGFDVFPDAVAALGGVPVITGLAMDATAENIHPVAWRLE